MAADDQAFGLQRLQRRADAGAADPKPFDHLALDEARARSEAQREDRLPQRLRAAPGPGVLSRPHEALGAYSDAASIAACGDEDR